MHYSNGTICPIAEDFKCKCNLKKKCYAHATYVKFLKYADYVNSETVAIRRVTNVFGNCKIPDDIIGVAD